jgi:hypothetical protein
MVTQTTTRAGVRSGTGIPNDPSNAGTQPSAPEPQVEAGPPLDMFVVYRGSTDPNWSPLDAPPVWRYSSEDAPASPSVPAVEVFRKADRGVGEVTGPPSVASYPLIFCCTS